MSWKDRFLQLVNRATAKLEAKVGLVAERTIRIKLGYYWRI